VQFFSASNLSTTSFVLQEVLDFVVDLVVEDDPESSWQDYFRNAIKSSNDSRLKILYNLSAEVRREVGKKVLECGGNAVLGYSAHFDIESGLVARAYGTACRLLKVGDITSRIFAYTPVRDGGSSDLKSSVKSSASGKHFQNPLAKFSFHLNDDLRSISSTSDVPITPPVTTFPLTTSASSSQLLGSLPILETILTNVDKSVAILPSDEADVEFSNLLRGSISHYPGSADAVALLKVAPNITDTNLQMVMIDVHPLIPFGPKNEKSLLLSQIQNNIRGEWHLNHPNIGKGAESKSRFPSTEVQLMSLKHFDSHVKIRQGNSSTTPIVFRCVDMNCMDV
jgi:hypothetical protein